MKAKAVQDTKSNVWNVFAEYEGEWIKMGSSKGICVEFLEFRTKEEAEEYIKDKDGLDLDENDKLYLILTTRHKNLYGKNYCLFWGYDENSGGYTGDPYHAHRYTYEEALERTNGEDDIMIDIEKLGLNKEYENHNKNILCLIEKGTLNRVLGLGLRR